MCFFLYLNAKDRKKVTQKILMFENDITVIITNFSLPLFTHPRRLIFSEFLIRLLKKDMRFTNNFLFFELVYVCFMFSSQHPPYQTLILMSSCIFIFCLTRQSRNIHEKCIHMKKYICLYQ